MVGRGKARPGTAQQHKARVSLINGGNTMAKTDSDIEIESNDKTKVVGITHANTLLLIKRLREAEVGDIIEYAELSKIIGMDVQSLGDGYLRTARDTLLRDNERFFGVVRGLGVMRCDSKQTNAIASSYRRKIRKAARKAQVILIKGVKYDDLNTDEQREHNVNLSVYGALQQFTKESNVAKVASLVSEENARLSIQQTLQAMGYVKPTE
jgi:hypothetical protein